jgi:hypothetical protein
MTLHHLKFIRAVALRAVACIVVVSCLAAADTSEVSTPSDGKSIAQKVREGLSHFFGGQFSDARTSFGEANEMAPDNELIRFDEACATLADGDVDAARGLFHSASLAKDTSLSIKSHYNLGCLEADLAKVKLGADPVEAVGDVREESIQLLMTSVRHYRDVLRLDRDHKDARYNIEVIRLFVKHIQSQWAERDKQRDREEKDLLQFILMLEEKETQIREDVRSLEEHDDSPQRRQVLREIAEGQRELQAEILPLKDKIKQALAAPQPQPGQPSTSGAQQPATQDEQSKEMLTAMTGIADDIGAKMLSAGDTMSSADFDGAEQSQTEALHLLNQLYMIVAPYDNLLQRSLKDQQRLAPVEHISGEETVDVVEDEVEEKVSEPATGMVEPKDVEHAVESQSRISDWARLLSLKADAALPQLKQQLASLPPVSDETSGEAGEEGEITVAPIEPDDATAAPDKGDAQDPAIAAAEAQIEQQQKQRQQLEGLLASMELAMELAPDAEQHSSRAVEHLLASEVEQASPEQTETLRILKEIAEPLKSDEQDQQQQQNDDKSQDQNENQQQDESKDQQNDKDNKQEQQKQQKQQKAESLLRQARERERDYRKKLKEQQAIFGTGVKVDKDW